jgi:hypothetical protein
VPCDLVGRGFLKGVLAIRVFVYSCSVGFEHHGARAFDWSSGSGE